MENEYRVIILPSGCFYDCESLTQARQVMEKAPMTDDETGRQLTENGIIIMEESRD